jgi:hypothetical protein
MDRTITGCFETRRAAELAVEHLVQEEAVERTDIFIAAPDQGNSAGSRAGGADVESGHPGHATAGQPALNGLIEISIDTPSERVGEVRRCLEQAGAVSVTQR